jgi:glycosyltransferase involved in cell wall biosynthesis
MVSIIIPARREKFLNKTIFDIQQKSDVEIIVVLDGEDAPRIEGVKYIYNPEAKGMRTAINQGVAMASKKYIMKSDAHCMFDDGFAEKLIAEHQPNWVQIPRRKRLDPNKWELIALDSPDVDYMFIGWDFRGYKDNDKNRDLAFKDILIDDVPIFQGSCYFMTKEYFNHLGLLDDINFGKMGSEALEIAMKCRHDGGRVIVNKKTWYAHAHIGRRYGGSTKEREISFAYIKKLAKQYGTSI